MRFPIWMAGFELQDFRREAETCEKPDERRAVNHRITPLHQLNDKASDDNKHFHVGRSMDTSILPIRNFSNIFIPPRADGEIH